MARVNYFDLWSPDCIKTFTDHCHTEHSLIMFFKEGKTFPIYTTRVYVRLMNIFFKNIYILKKTGKLWSKMVVRTFRQFQFCAKISFIWTSVLFISTDNNTNVRMVQTQISSKGMFSCFIKFPVFRRVMFSISSFESIYTICLSAKVMSQCRLSKRE